MSFVCASLAFFHYIIFKANILLSEGKSWLFDYLRKRLGMYWLAKGFNLHWRLHWRQAWAPSLVSEAKLWDCQCWIIISPVSHEVLLKLYLPAKCWCLAREHHCKRSFSLGFYCWQIMSIALHRALSGLPHSTPAIALAAPLFAIYMQSAMKWPSTPDIFNLEGGKIANLKLEYRHETCIDWNVS